MDLETGPNNIGIENADAVPEALHSFFQEDSQTLGHLAIDSNINGLSVGGIRLVPEMPVADLCHLARVMTLKYSFLKMPFGGAKAAIFTHCNNPSVQQRKECIESFAGRLVAFRGRYLPGVDVGLNADDLNVIRRIARLERVSRPPDSGFYTALTVRICIEHLARGQGIKLAQCTAAIEGFGKVGGWVARLLAELGCRIVAISTKKGAIHDPDGLDVDKLLRARDAFGDDCSDKYDGARRIEIPQLLSLATDLLIPCALSWSIRSANAGEVQASVIVCGANNAVTDRAREILAANHNEPGLMQGDASFSGPDADIADHARIGVEVRRLLRVDRSNVNIRRVETVHDRMLHRPEYLVVEIFLLHHDGHVSDVSSQQEVPDDRARRDRRQPRHVLRQTQRHVDQCLVLIDVHPDGRAGGPGGGKHVTILRSEFPGQDLVAGGPAKVLLRRQRQSLEVRQAANVVRPYARLPPFPVVDLHVLVRVPHNLAQPFLLKSLQLSGIELHQLPDPAHRPCISQGVDKIADACHLQNRASDHAHSPLVGGSRRRIRIAVCPEPTCERRAFYRRLE